ncbi:DNA-dependent RNA polymerase [Pseudomassariella vexata]|uniref:DNA-directed RNA polymerase n=1 Tax=Pseudomassariella vexata TaxID=1141098 RepID=A0A1Y2E0Y5_9PEZI|nr:DNA-dependent RNA polymerase [Pseudomassariella vexata]ORY65004.1 DNA-dependent RNA polymerase [Pseudomassariella vexata]
MLIRPAARRSLPLAFPRENSLTRHQLPSRCPSFQATRRLLVTRSEARPRQRTSALAGHGPLHERSLATAMDETLYPYSSTLPPMVPPRSFDIRYFDPSAPLLIKYKQDPLPRTRMTPNAVPGDVEAALSVFDACLQVDQLERAAIVLKRLEALQHGLLPDDMLTLHNRYLRANIDRFIGQPSIKWADSMQRWYECRIRGPRLPETTETIACMLKIALLSTNESDRLERLVHRYMEMVPDAGTEMLQQYMNVILTPQDVSKITEFCPEYKITFDESEAVDCQPLESTDESLLESATNTTALPDMPEVRAVNQKGFGLNTLRSVLSFFSELQGQDLSKLSLSERREFQSQLERDCVDAAIRRWREENEALKKIGKNAAISAPALNAQLYEWHCTLETKIKEEFDLFEESEERTSKTAEDQDRCLVAPFMRQSKPDRLAAVTVMSVLNTLTQHGVDNGVALSTCLNYLARAVEEDVKTQARDEESAARKAAWKTRTRQAMETPSSSVTPPDAILSEASSNVVEVTQFDPKTWPVLIRTKIGATLLSAFIDTAKVVVGREHPDTQEHITQVQPAFAHTNVTKKGKKIGMIMPNKYLVDLIKTEPRADFLARHLPMLVVPQPWTKFDKGGFIEFPASLVRIKNGEKDQKIYTEAAVGRGDMEQVSKGLDVLGRTAWRINQPVFQVLLEAWNTGEEIANIPPANPSLTIPAEPESCGDPTERRQWLKEVKAIENEKSGLHSERCFMNFQLEIGRAFKDQVFYFPHNMDFRGRAYPIPTYLNHMGADHARAILIFAKGKELGESGLRWLKVHLANVFGYDKASLKEREAFTMNNLDNIFDSTDNPLHGKRWWLTAEDPWQCLAACFEVKAALQSPDPTKYVSHLPVHQDGTCNGLQHYAALGGDLWGAQQVNLEPGDRPADVYSAVAELVKESVAADLKEDSFLAKAVDGKISRKVVKQTVMTNVYGVTFIGARAQVQKQLDAAYPHIMEETGIPSRLLAQYVAGKIFKALGTMFRGAHDIQYWLGECAGRVCRALTAEQLEQINSSADLQERKTGKRSRTQLSGPKESKEPKETAQQRRKKAMDQVNAQFRSTIVWTTPLRMPVVQPYRQAAIRQIQTCLQELNLRVPDRFDPVDRRKQLQAFPPNFIHSLDASHMLLSALECSDLGLDFAAVHDSFWTHAADIDVMNRVLRDSFIRIHKEDVIKRLATEFEARHKGSYYLAKLESGGELENILQQYRKKSKQNMKDELVQETERLRLLKSQDPKEVQRGREMETPTTIAQAYAGSHSASGDIDEDMAEIGLGHIPSSEAIAMADAASNHDGDEETYETEPKPKRKAAKSKALPPNSDIPDEAAHVRELMGMTAFESLMKGKKATVPTGARASYVWLPLTFPELPKKGDWDVTRLKDSQYFFS